MGAGSSGNIKYNFDEVVDRYETGCEKYDYAYEFNHDLPDDFISMWVADMDFPTPKPVMDAVKRRSEHPFLAYTMDIDHTLFNSLRFWLKRRQGWMPKVEHILTTTGVARAIFHSSQYFAKEDEGVLLFTPGYTPFNSSVVAFGRKPVYCRLVQDMDTNYYTIDFDDFEQKCKDPKNKLLLLCSPHNPTGRVWKEEELRRIAEICFANDVFIVVDEIHADIVRKNVQFTSLGKLYPNDDRIIILTAPSKAFNMSGLQLSFIIVPNKQIRTDWIKRRYEQQPNPLGVEGCKAAYNECESWVDQMNSYLDENFKLLGERLMKELPQAVYSVSEGTYLAWVDLHKFNLSDDELKRLITRSGVLLEYHKNFIDNDEHHIRINISCPRSVLNEAITRIIRALVDGYESPQFKGQLKQGDSFPIESIVKTYSKVSLLENGKTVFIFLRHPGCRLTQIYLRKFQEHIAEIKSKNARIYIFINSSEKYYHDHMDSQVNFGNDNEDLLLFDLDGTIFDLLCIRCTTNKRYLLDEKTASLNDEALELGIQEHLHEPKSRELQRPALFIVNNDSALLYSYYGHGSGDIPNGQELISLL